MGKINIQFQGITRNTDDELSTDGECMELINARIKDGSVQPVGNPILLKSLNVLYKGCYYHPLGHRYLFIRTSNGGIDSYDESFTFVSTFSTDLSVYGGINKIEFVGNIVCLFTSTNIIYYIYKSNDYVYLGTRPDMPVLKIGQTLHSAQVVTASKYYGPEAINTDTSIDPSIDLSKVGYGFFDECISKLNKQGCFIDKTLIRFAFRLFDGTYFMQSPVYLVQNTGSINITLKFNSTDSSDYQTGNLGEGCFFIMEKGRLPGLSNKDYYEFAIAGFKPTFNFSNLNLGVWKDIIMSIDVFSCGSIMEYELIEKGVKDPETLSGQTGKYYQYEYRTADGVKKAILEKNLFYKIAEYDLNGNEIDRLDNVSDSNLALEMLLPDDNETLNTITANKTYTYNSRLHVADILQSYFKGYQSDYEIPCDYKYPLVGNASSPVTKATVYTYLNTQNGTVILKKEFGSEFPYPHMSPFIMYPDNRAYKMVFIVTTSSGIKRKDFPLTPHKYLNMACYWGVTWEPKNSWDYTNGASGWYYPSIIDKASDLNLDISTWDNGTDDILTEQNTTLSRGNIVKVSRLNNPFVFPSNTTYQPSTRTVIGMCSNTSALSQGQFGEHPLYVFCEDGIFAMTVGTDVVYATSKPMSRFVCNNPLSIKGLDQAVVFSTDQGIMLLSGSDVENISKKIDGYIPSAIDSSPVIGKIVSIAGMSNIISDTEFKNYVSGAQIGYNYKEREIIVANSSYGYCYVYSILSASWFKMNSKILSFVNSYPDVMALSVTDTATNIYNMDNQYRSISKIVMLTRPVKMGTMTLKRIIQSALRAIVKRSLSDLYLRGESVHFRGDDLTIFSDVGFYILGSNDAEHFNLIGGKEKMVDVRDLITKMNKSKPYKFFMFCLVGGVRTDVAINYVECVVDESFTNRLR